MSFEQAQELLVILRAISWQLPIIIGLVGGIWFMLFLMMEEK